MRIALIFILSLVVSSNILAQTEKEKDFMFYTAKNGCGADLYKLSVMLKEHPEYMDVKDQDGNNLILLSAKVGNINSFSHLEELGFDPYSENSNGQDALAVNIERETFGANIYFINWLLKKHDGIRFVNHADNDGMYPIMHAVEQGQPFLVIILHREYGASLDVVNNDDVSLAMMLAEKGETSCLKYLKDNGAKFSGVDKDGHDVIWYAKNKSKKYIVAWELELWAAEEEAKLKTDAGLPQSKLLRHSDVVQEKKDMLFNLQKYCKEPTLNDIKKLSDIFVLLVLKKGVDDNVRDILFGRPDGVYDTYGLYDHWVENAEQAEYSAYLIMMGALVVNSGDLFTINYLPSISKGYKVVLGETFSPETDHKLTKVASTYDAASPGIYGKMDLLAKDLCSRSVKIIK